MLRKGKKQAKANRTLSIELNSRVIPGRIVVVGLDGAGKSAWINAVREHAPDSHYTKKYKGKHPLELCIIENRTNVSFHFVEIDSLEHQETKKEELMRASVCVICFSLVDWRSLDSVNTWANLIRQECPNRKILLLGTKMDLRDDAERRMKKKHTKNNDKPTPYAESLETSSTDDFFRIQALPAEVLEQIFLYLSISQRARVAQVCKSWNYILSEKCFGHTIYGAPTSKTEGKKLADSFKAKYCECSITTGKGVFKAAKLCFSDSRKLKQAA